LRRNVKKSPHDKNIKIYPGNGTMIGLMLFHFKVTTSRKQYKVYYKCPYINHSFLKPNVLLDVDVHYCCLAYCHRNEVINKLYNIKQSFRRNVVITIWKTRQI